MTRFFFDTEFIEDGKTIDLLSLAIVSENRGELYVENLDADLSKASPWVQENVLPHLNQPGAMCMTRADIAAEVVDFVNACGGEPEFWAYYADYDWVVLCQLFGTMMDLPEGWPMYCRDLKQTIDETPAVKVPADPEEEHHALADARWLHEAWLETRAQKVRNAQSSAMKVLEACMALASETHGA